MVAMVDFFQPMILVKNCTFRPCFFLDKMGLEVVFDDCPRLQILYFT